MSLRGSIDRLDTQGASGWLYDTARGQPVMVQALLDGRVIGEAPAELSRPDLASAGFGDGHCGFDIPFPEPVDAASLPFVTIKPQGGDVELPRTNLTSFGNYFRALFGKYPGAGRHRSVLGGLWIDRTDAARLLRGRVASGATPAELSGAIEALAHNGYAVLKGALAPVGFGGNEMALVKSLEPRQPLDPQSENAARRLLEALPGTLFRDAVVRTLRAVLDDNPLAYRVVLSRGQADAYAQPSTAEALTSPAECLALVACPGPEPALLDIIQGSHQLPEFTASGQSRYAVAAAAAGMELAVGQALPVERIEVNPADVVLLGPGTIYRLRTPKGSTAVTTWCAPAHVTPVDFTNGRRGTFTVRHASGAALTI